MLSVCNQPFVIQKAAAFVVLLGEGAGIRGERAHVGILPRDILDVYVYVLLHISKSSKLQLFFCPFRKTLKVRKWMQMGTVPEIHIEILRLN